MVKRYYTGDKRMELSETGHWVLFEDYAALLMISESLIAEGDHQAEKIKALEADLKEAVSARDRWRLIAMPTEPALKPGGFAEDTLTGQLLP